MIGFDAIPDAIWTTSERDGCLGSVAQFPGEMGRLGSDVRRGSCCREGDAATGEEVLTKVEIIDLGDHRGSLTKASASPAEDESGHSMMTAEPLLRDAG